MRHPAIVSMLALALTITGCEAGVVSGSDGGPRDAARTDVRTVRADASVGDARADVPQIGPDDVPAAPQDAADVVTPRDVVTTPDPTCTMGPPLEAPIAGCSPSLPESTGDPQEDCWRRINAFRCECQHLPPLARWTDGEACANQMAQYDHDNPSPSHAAFRARICNGGSGQNECPGWGSIPQAIGGCLQQMWDEGPGDFYGPPPHGHYINMSSTSFSRVACGFYMGSGGVYAVQNFQ